MSNAALRKAIDRFLRHLRAGGRSNMYGAVPYVMKTFALDRHTAFTLVCEWMDRQVEGGTLEGSPARVKGRVR
ncbi:MAG TPA: hypothetical protein VD930_01875 [Gemmatimonadales bacterium]|nr:hypothetical protein [Gemmatimonadales bacterium]